MAANIASPAAAIPRVRAPQHVVRLGDYVNIGPERRTGAPDSEGGVGSVTYVHEDGSFDLKYSLSNRIEQHVRPRRILC